MPTKIKLPQKQEFTERDMFKTPRYATELLIPFLEKSNIKNVWECASGSGNISSVLRKHNFEVIESDRELDFLKNTMSNIELIDAIVTNPPYSLKINFYKRCIELGKPFALLIPCDMSVWIINAMQDGCEKIVPIRRIDYLTPYQLQKINDDIVLEKVNTYLLGHYNKKEGVSPDHWKDAKDYLIGANGLYQELEDVPVKVLRKYTSCEFHSMWLTKGLNIGKQESYAELTNEMKNNIF